MKKNLFITIILLLLPRILYCDNQPHIERTIWNHPAPGYIFLGPMNYSQLAVYDNSGYIVYSKDYGFFGQGFADFKIHPNGKISFFDFLSSKFVIADSNFNILETVSTVGYNTDFHEFLILPNNNYLLFGIEYKSVDMSKLVPNGHRNATVRNFIIQEINHRNKQVVWEWNVFDHISILDATEDIDLTASYINPYHLNSYELTSDGNLILCFRNLDQLVKINKQTGSIIWRMGGSKARRNDFTFVNDTIDGFFGFSHQHEPRILSNGNLLLFDNGNLRPTPFSRVVEYQIDETRKTVTKVWEYIAPNNIVSYAMGGAQRLPNGNTLISWGGPESDSGHRYLLSEVTPQGEITLEYYSDYGTYRAYKYIFKLDAVTLRINSTNTYSFSNSQFNTNLVLQITSLSGQGDITVEKHKYQPHNLNQGGPCAAIPYRWVVTKRDINSIRGTIQINLSGLGGFSNPSNFKIFYRQGEGFGPFTELNTTYNPSQNTLTASFAGFGEYCIGSITVGIPKPLLPENKSINNLVPTRFIWNSYIYGEKYDLQISTDSLFTNIIYNIQNISDTAFTIPDLANGKTFYWRIRSKRENCNSAWSATQSFTTIYEKVELFSPENNVRHQLLNIPFSWQSNNNAKGYQFQLAYDSVFHLIVIDTIVYNAGINVSNLAYFTEYYWRVRLIRDKHFGIWSEVRTFQTMLSAPFYFSPSNNSKNIPINGTLSWVDVPGALHYNFVLSKSPNFIKNIVEVPDLKKPKYEYEGLEPYTEYYWKVQSIGEFGKSNWSEVQKFKTQLQKPTIMTPTDSDTLVSLKTLLKWSSVPFALKYLVEVSEDKNFQIGVLRYNSNSAFILINDLVYSTKYYWRVKAICSDAESPWSDVSSFRTVPERYLPPPTLFYPENNSMNFKIGNYLVWIKEPFANEYEIQVSTDQTFFNLIANQKTSDTLFKTTNLSYGTRYYWRVRAINETQQSNWSSIFSFTTLLRTPSLIYPKDKSPDLTLPIDFQWEKTGANLFFRLQIAYDPDFEFLLNEQNLYQQTSFTLTKASTETWFYWRVKAFAGQLESEWSETRTFKIGSTSNVEEYLENAVLIFPNPFNDKLTIQTNTDNSEIWIYNELSELLFNSSGSTNYIWQPSVKSAGTFIVKVRIDNIYHIQKIILLP
ncbi:MAG: aryl-sulfate sulfotransferase [Ignavibacteria bacterium]|nr:aryl-sulfate sulfotransferase [Ignavibacteria bacterium]